MYFQITTRCNMSCEHCCFSCTKDGKDMSLKTFKKGIDTFGVENISIGGGEPTLHPKFWPMVLHSLGHCEYTWLATNGSKTEISMLLAMLTSKKVLSCELSLDSWHDENMVSRKVIGAFRNLGNNTYNNKPSNIRNVEEKVCKQGRAIENGVYDRNDCACSGGMVKPNGKVMMCGCENSLEIGNVNDGYYDKYKDILSEYDCVKQYNKEVNND